MLLYWNAKVSFQKVGEEFWNLFYHKLFDGDRMDLMKVEFRCQESGWVDLLW